MQCLLLWLKSRSVREASRHPAFMDNFSTISHMCSTYLPSRWVLLFVPGVAERNEDAGWIFFLFLMLIRWNEEGRWVEDFVLLPQGIESFPSDQPRARWRDLVCGVLISVDTWHCFNVYNRQHRRRFIDVETTSCVYWHRWLSHWWLVFVLSELMLLWVMGVDLRTLTKFQGSEMSPGLFRDFMDGYIRLSPQAVEHSVVIMTAGSQSRRSYIESYG